MQKYKTYRRKIYDLKFSDNFLNKMPKTWKTLVSWTPLKLKTSVTHII